MASAIGSSASGLEKLRVDIRDYGAVPNREDAGATNAIAIQQALDDLTRRVFELSSLPWSYGDSLQGTLLIPSDGVYLVDRPLFADGQVRIASAGNGRGRLQAIGVHPLLVLGQDVRDDGGLDLDLKGGAGAIGSGISFREAMRTTRFSSFAGQVNSSNTLGYNLRDVSLMVRCTPFDVDLETRGRIAFGLIYRTQPDASAVGFAQFWRAGPHVLGHDNKGFYLKVRTSDQRMRTFRVPLAFTDSTLYKVFLQVDLDAGTVAAAVNGVIQAVDASGAGDFAAGGVRLDPLTPTQEGYVGILSDPASGGSDNRVDLLGLKLSSYAYLDPSASPGTSISLSDGAYVDMGRAEDFAVLAPADQAYPGYARTKFGGKLPGWAIFRPNRASRRFACDFELEGLVLCGSRRTPYAQAVLHLVANDTTVKDCQFRYGGRGYDEPGSIMTNWTLRISDCKFSNHRYGGLSIGPSMNLVERCLFQYTGPYAVSTVGGGVFRDLICVESGSVAPIRVTGETESIRLIVEDCQFPNEAAIPDYQVHVTRTMAHRTNSPYVQIRNLAHSGTRKATVLLDTRPALADDSTRAVCILEPSGPQYAGAPAGPGLAHIHVDGANWCVTNGHFPLGLGDVLASNFNDPGQPIWTVQPDGGLPPRPAPDPMSADLAAVGDFWTLPGLAGHYRAEDQGADGTAVATLVDCRPAGSSRPARDLPAYGVTAPAAPASVALKVTPTGGPFPVLRFPKPGAGCYRNPTAPASGDYTGLTVVAVGAGISHLFRSETNRSNATTVYAGGWLPKGDLPPGGTNANPDELNAFTLRWDRSSTAIDFFCNGQFAGGTYLGPGFVANNWVLGTSVDSYGRDLAEVAVFYRPLTDREIRKAHYWLARKYSIAW